MKTPLFFLKFFFISSLVGLFACTYSEKDSQKQETLVEEKIQNTDIIEAGHDMKESNYPFILAKVIKELKLKQKPTDEDIEACIPQTEDEYLFFYSYTDPDSSTQKAFADLNKIIGKGAIELKMNFLPKYLKLSAFVDGEYAEGYFEDVDFVIGKNPQVFCKLFSTEDSSKMIRLKEFYLDYCEEK